ncbi:Ion transport 2 [Corchorus olitorius]|uniref:Ion transport 2 n=1 Tax=Corchorus olitorius TaxID=93759 RepID=A0A1R3II87_9ROSI|nr:Ion transport 2 [Corchorus olitorius]
MADDEPFLSPQTKSQLRPIIEDDHDLNGFYFAPPQSISTPAIFPSEIQDLPQIQVQEQETPHQDHTNARLKKAGTLQRCKSAPGMAIMRDLKPKRPQVPKPQSDSSSILRQAIFLLSIYLLLGVGIYSFNRDEFSGIETHPVVDALYFFTTVGYGDRAFKTLPGRLFAGVWLLISTLAVARAFLYLAEARVDKRHRRIAKWVLQREITIEDLLAANINNNGFIRLDSIF